MRNDQNRPDFAGLNPNKLLKWNRDGVAIPVALLDHVDERLHFDGAGPAFPPTLDTMPKFPRLSGSAKVGFLRRLNLAVFWIWSHSV
jgi:hypothetical protein